MAKYSSKPGPEENSVSGNAAWWFRFFDVAAKMIGAIAIAAVTLFVHNYESRMSATALLSQREQAETNLRASMLHDLVDPILSPGQGSPDPQRELLLAELLALNFHDHFEFKPLLENVAAKVDKLGRNSLEQIARRVADRQINMLLATHTSATPARAMVIYCRKASQGENISPSPECSPFNGNIGDNGQMDGKGSQMDPLVFSNFTGESVCIYSPDRKIKVEMAIIGYRFSPKQAHLSLNIYRNGSDREPSYSTSDFWITPFDFPLTDNTRLDSKHRFAFVLYEMSRNEGDDEAPLEIVLKMIWFPEGYITPTERPVNYQEIRKLLMVNSHPPGRSSK